jgi:hypothetical protein
VIPYKLCRSKEEAWRFVHDQAARLRRLGIARRYGLYCRPVEESNPHGNWGVYLIDREKGEK